jgi:putative transcriptional regulator
MLGENIKYYRQNKGYTQEAVANHLHVTRQTISKWEKNYSVPDADLLVKMAEMFEIETSSLLGPEAAGNNEAEGRKDAYAEQLARIAEQMAVKNRMSKRIWKTVGIVVSVFAVLVVIGIVLSVAAFSAYTFDAQEGSIAVCEESIASEE